MLNLITRYGDVVACAGLVHHVPGLRREARGEVVGARLELDAAEAALLPDAGGVPKNNWCSTDLFGHTHAWLAHLIMRQVLKSISI